VKRTRARRTGASLLGMALLAGGVFPAPLVAASELTPAALLAAARRVTGPAAGAKLPVIDATARCTGPDGPFTTRVVSAPDGRMRFEQHGSSGATAVLGIVGNDAWQYDWLGDSTAAAGPAHHAFLRGHEFLYLALAPETRLEGPEPDTLRVVLDGREAPAVRFRTTTGGTVDLAFDEVTDLPLGFLLADTGAAAGPPVRVRYDGWGREGNLFLPRRIQIAHGNESFAYDLSGGIRPDPDIGDPFRPSGDFGANADVAELRRLQREARDAHLQYDAERLVASFHDPLTGLSRGEVSRSTPEENRERFGGYLKSVEFDEWADTAPPLIRVSADGSMAYVIVQKRVRLRTRTTPPQTESVQFAWMEAWEKRNGAWRLMAVASTEKELEEGQ
jgi:hypothetical protein